MTDGADQPDSDQPSSPRTLRARTLSDEDAARLWAEFGAGRVARCPRDQGAVALAVDSASKSYRLVCTDCGTASLWFWTSAAGIHPRNADDTIAPGPPED